MPDLKTDPSWLSPDVSKEIQAPIQRHIGSRSAGDLCVIVEQFQVGTAERYRKRDLDGKPGDETCCNYFVREVLIALGMPTNRMRANELYAYLLVGSAGSGGAGWAQVRPWIARLLANAGYPVVAAWQNPLGPGHVAIVVPSRSDDHGTFIAQAGSTNFAYGRLEQGFGQRPVALFAHP
jgi:hypothetical protein